jgi:hypothetical protein
MSDLGHHDTRIEVVERRVDRVEEDHLDLRREVGELKAGMATLHGDLRVNNALTEHIKDSVSRIERNTSDSFGRIEANTKDALLRLEKSTQQAVDIATAARVVGSKPVVGIVAWVAGGAITVILVLVGVLRNQA